jgi:putative molybdopterin biosynthesis protein
MIKVMKVSELADYLHVHSSTIYKMVRKGELPAFRVGSDIRFDAEAIDRWCSGERGDGGPSQ